MNYIKQLQATVEDQAAELRRLRAERVDLHLYLLSDKFHQDPTVQVQDVLNRMPVGAAI